MSTPPALAEAGFLLGRVLFALVVAYLAFGNLRDLSGTVAYADSKGAPMPAVTVPFGSGLLFVGSLSVLFGVFPLVGSLAIAGFLTAITPLMHDFWNAEDQAAENERIHFLKNVGLLGATFVLLASTGLEWPYAIVMAL